MNDNKAELLPCPFCGGDANVQLFDKVLNIGCASCDIRTKFMVLDDFETAKRLWNNRAERTCTVDGVICHEYEYESGYRGVEYEYTFSCGHGIVWGSGYEPCFCPWCGAEVVE